MDDNMNEARDELSADVESIKQPMRKVRAAAGGLLSTYRRLATLPRGRAHTRSSGGGVE